MRQWLSFATREEALLLAKRAKTSLGVLRQIAGGYRTGGAASTTPEAARRIEIASKSVTPDMVIPREALCQACAKCEYLKENKND